MKKLPREAYEPDFDATGRSLNDARDYAYPLVTLFMPALQFETRESQVYQRQVMM